MAIYHGIPSGTVGGESKNLAEKTDVSTSDLDSSVLERLSNGEIKFNSYAEAEELVQSYRDNIAAKKAQEAQKSSSATEGSKN